MDIAYCSSPIGVLKISADGKWIRSVDFVNKNGASRWTPTLKKCAQELGEYFQKKRSVFSFQCQPEGTEFQKKVWNALIHLPFGSTETYSGLADKIGHKKAVRAVGSACGSNRLAILIPCHRVIASDGRLAGYASGLRRKKWLLEHENQPKKRVSKAL